MMAHLNHHDDIDYSVLLSPPTARSVMVHFETMACLTLVFLSLLVVGISGNVERELVLQIFNG